MMSRFMTIAAAFCLTACSTSLDSVTPTAVPQGEVSQIEVVGQGLSEDMTFSLDSAGLSVSLRQVSVEAERAVLEVPAAAPAGLYSILASGAAEASLEDALRVDPDAASFTFVDVGQGDATLIEEPGGGLALLDGGKPSRTDIVKAAIADTNRTLSLVLLSHFDADHLGGIVGVLKGPDGTAGTDDDLVPSQRYSPDDDGACASQLCDEFRALRAYPFTTPEPGETLTFGRVDLVVEAVSGRVGNAAIPADLDANGRSLAVRAVFAERSVLVLGDLTGGGLGTADLESAVAARTGAVDVLRAGHHGSQTSTNQTAIATWQPRLTVLSLGTDNAFCHPAPQVLSRLSTQSTRVIGTGAGMVTDGACDFTTADLDNVELGRGTFVVSIDAAGALTVDGEPL